MQLPIFDAASGARPFQWILAIVLFPLLGIGLSGLVGWIRIEQYAKDVRLQREGVTVTATIANLRTDFHYTGSGSSRRRVDDYHVDLRYGVDGTQPYAATLTVTRDEFGSFVVGGTVPLVVARTAPSVFARPEEVEESRTQSPTGIWASSIGGSFCCSGVVSVIVAVAKPRRRSRFRWRF